MKKLIKTHYAYILIFAFIIISGFTMFMCCDDYIWFYAFSDDRLSSYASPNGRYFTNFITRFSVQCLPLYSVFYIISFGSLVILLEKLVRKQNIPVPVSLLSVFVLIQFIPSKIYTEVFRWISGFNNYCFAFIFTLIYILFSFKLIFFDYKPKIYTSFLFLVIGFFGCLCVEHLTIYNIIFCIFAVAVTYVRKKKLFLHHFCFLTGAIAGAVLMLSHSIYHTVAVETDELGTRGFELSIVDSFMQILRFVLPHFCKDFWILHILVTVVFTVFYYRNENSKKFKYAGLCLTCCWVFVIYLMFTSVFQDLAVLSSAMKIRAIEFAFTFLYICALIYNIVVYLKPDERLRALVYLFSSVTLTIPFAIVSPVTPRCFFIEYLFWILFALEVLFASMKRVKCSVWSIYKRILICTSCGIFVLFANMNITNCLYDHKRFEYLQEQMSSKSRGVDLMLLPYQKYAYDDFSEKTIFSGVLKDDVSYGEYILKYHGISYEDFMNRNRRMIEAIDYNESKASE